MTDEQLNKIVKEMTEENRKYRRELTAKFDGRIALLRKELRLHYTKTGKVRVGKKHRAEVDRIYNLANEVEREREQAVPVVNPFLETLRNHPAYIEQNKRYKEKRAKQNQKNQKLENERRKQGAKKIEANCNDAIKASIAYFDKYAQKEQIWQDATPEQQEMYRTDIIINNKAIHDKLQKALAVKDVGTVVSMFGLPNPLTCEIFRGITGKKIPRNRDSFWQEFFGQDYLVWVEGQAERQKEVLEAKQAEERDAALSRLITWDAQEITIKKLIDTLILEGYEPYQAKSGCIPVVRLKRSGRYYEFKNKHEKQYIEGLKL